VFVGEAPGRQEDLQGKPFVGGAGKVFDELLASVGLSRADVYVTNAVKSRPVVGTPRGRNRPPTREEIAACAPWLTEEIEIVQPKVVVTLGQIALEHFLPRRKLSEVHGTAQLADGMTILPLYHPAMARYGPKWMALLKRDFRRIPKIVGRTLEPRT
jgi:uracil-DNA glycosylase family 4